MKITRIEKFKVVVPMKPGTVNSPQWGPPAFAEWPHFIIRVHTDARDIIGIGETQREIPPEDVDTGIAALLGKAPLEMNLQALPLPAGNHAYQAFEMAIFDIVGKGLGLPAWKLLGGRFRDRVEVDYWCGRKTPEDIAQTAKEGTAKGFKGLKMKCALEDPMVERVQAIAKAAPSMMITIDPNTRFYRPIEAIKLAKKLEGYNVECFEDPTPKWNLDWYAHMRANMRIPLALHLGSVQDLLNAIKKECIDYVNLSPGSMVRFVKLGDIAYAAGLPFWHGSGVDLGIMDMSYVHACAAAQGCTLRSDIIGNFLREDDLIVEPIAFKDGCALVPDKPGLGVELDEKAVAKYSVK